MLSQSSSRSRQRSAAISDSNHPRDVDEEKEVPEVGWTRDINTRRQTASPFGQPAVEVHVKRLLRFGSHGQRTWGFGTSTRADLRACHRLLVSRGGAPPKCESSPNRLVPKKAP